MKKRERDEMKFPCRLAEWRLDSESVTGNKKGRLPAYFKLCGEVQTWGGGCWFWKVPRTLASYSICICATG